MSKAMVYNGYTFVSNNFMAILDHHEVPEAYHTMQDYLSCGPLAYALTQPEKFSAKACIQIWSTLNIDDAKALKFTYNSTEYTITKEVIAAALKLETDTSFIESYSDGDVRQWLSQLGYNGDLQRLGKLLRARMRKEWNFFFDCIGKAFTNKCSNFDALTQLTQQIGYGLLNNAILDIPTYLLEFIRSRNAENPQVIYFPRFLHLIFFHLCQNVTFENDERLPAHTNSARSWADMNKDEKHGFVSTIEYPPAMMALLQERMPEIYGARAQDTSESVPLCPTQAHNPNSPNTHLPPLVPPKRGQL